MCCDPARRHPLAASLPLSTFRRAHNTGQVPSHGQEPGSEGKATSSRWHEGSLCKQGGSQGAWGLVCVPLAAKHTLWLSSHMCWPGISSQE